jgi:hypothetical protein
MQSAIIKHHVKSRIERIRSAALQFLQRLPRILISMRTPAKTFFCMENPPRLALSIQLQQKEGRKAGKYTSLMYACRMSFYWGSKYFLLEDCECLMYPNKTLNPA